MFLWCHCEPEGRGNLSVSASKNVIVVNRSCEPKARQEVKQSHHIVGINAKNSCSFVIIAIPMDILNPMFFC
jgi:hypothetical protein